MKDVSMKAFEIQAGTPDIMIGMDYFFCFIKSWTADVDGWIKVDSLVGDMFCKDASLFPKEKQTISALVVDTNRYSNERMNDECEKMWDLDAVGIKDDINCNDDMLASQKFRATTRFDNNRYYVSWPVKEDHKPLPSNAGLALGQLRTAWKRFQDNPEEFELANKVITEQLDNGKVEVAPKIPDGNMVYYLPWFFVFTTQKATTKARMVFDASAKSKKDYPSLNDCLYRGRVKVPDLCGLLLRSRATKYLLVGDIEKAFHQILLNLKDRDAVRIFWIKDPKLPPEGKNLVVLRFVAVPFGVISSPSILGEIIGLHLESLENKVNVEQVENNTYVDNLFFFMESIEEAIKTFWIVKDHFAKASMNVREWLSNCININSAIPENIRQKEKVRDVFQNQSLR